MNQPPIPRSTGLQQAVPASGVSRGDPGPERGAPLLRDAEPAGGDTGSGFAQGGDAAGRTYAVGWVSLYSHISPNDIAKKHRLSLVLVGLRHRR